MPVTPLPPSNTKRYFVLYTTSDEPHEFMCRVPSSLGDSAAITMLQAFLVGILDHFTNNTEFVGLEVAAEGSDVRLPVSGWTNQTGTSSVSANNEARANQLTFVGRGASGRKARVGFYGTAITPDGNFRLTTSEAAVNDILAAIEGTSNGFKCIDGTDVTWHQYANYGYNDHWVRELRKLG